MRNKVKMKKTSEPKKKKKKTKVTYIDDGRSLADMSSVGRGGMGSGMSRGTGSLKDRTKTFLAAMRMMFVPMLVTMGIISIAFFIVWLLMTFAA